MIISHETIYKSLFIQARGVLKKELLAHLRSRRIMRRGRTATTSGQTRGQILTLCRSGTDQQKSRIAPFPATVKATC